MPHHAPNHQPPDQRPAAVAIIRQLQHQGFTAYLAGGCVRDALLGLPPKDHDVATDARPEQVQRLFPRARAVGEAFGVMLVYRNGHAIEIATFRTEWGYADKRRPDGVAFTDAEHDARRRDFTINGLFADPLQHDPLTGGDRIIDYVGGRDDIQSRLIRAIGDPEQRFGEDYLRMLRAPRFAARLGFTIEPRTEAAIRPLAKHLGQISRERIGQEIQATLTSPRPAIGAELVERLHLDGPALQEDHRQGPLTLLNALGPEPPYPAALLAWMIDRHCQPTSPDTLAQFLHDRTPKHIRRWRKALCFSNEQRAQLTQLADSLACLMHWNELPLARRKRLLARPTRPELMKLLDALPLQTPLPSRIREEAAQLLEQGVQPTPLISGDDLIQLGLTPGPRFGKLLEAAYDAQLEGRLHSKEQALQWLREQVEPTD